MQSALLSKQNSQHIQRVRNFPLIDYFESTLQGSTLYILHFTPRPLMDTSTYLEPGPGSQTPFRGRKALIVSTVLSHGLRSDR